MINGNNGITNWFHTTSNASIGNVTDSFKHTEKLSNLFSKGRSLSDKINNLKDIKVDVIEKSLENEEKTFTLKIVGTLNLNNKQFIKDIAEQFASILDKYKKEKIEELSKELDGVITEVKNLFPAPVTTWINSNGYGSDNTILCKGNVGSNLLNENIVYGTGNLDLTKLEGNSSISWKVE